jgi:hypothetical protein
MLSIGQQTNLHEFPGIMELHADNKNPSNDQVYTYLNDKYSIGNYIPGSKYYTYTHAPELAMHRHLFNLDEVAAVVRVSNDHRVQDSRKVLEPGLVVYLREEENEVVVAALLHKSAKDKSPNTKTCYVVLVICEPMVDAERINEVGGFDKLEAEDLIRVAHISQLDFQKSFSESHYQGFIDPSTWKFYSTYLLNEIREKYKNKRIPAKMRWKGMEAHSSQQLRKRSSAEIDAGPQLTEFEGDSDFEIQRRSRRQSKGVEVYDPDAQRRKDKVSSKELTATKSQSKKAKRQPSRPVNVPKTKKGRTQKDSEDPDDDPEIDLTETSAPHVTRKSSRKGQEDEDLRDLNEIINPSSNVQKGFRHSNVYPRTQVPPGFHSWTASNIQNPVFIRETPPTPTFPFNLDDLEKMFVKKINETVPGFITIALSGVESKIQQLMKIIGDDRQERMSFGTKIESTASKFSDQTSDLKTIISIGFEELKTEISELTKTINARGTMLTVDEGDKLRKSIEDSTKSMMQEVMKIFVAREDANKTKENPAPAQVSSQPAYIVHTPGYHYGGSQSYSGRQMLTNPGMTENDAMQMFQSMFRSIQQPSQQQPWFQDTLNRRASPTRPAISFSSRIQSTEPVAPMASSTSGPSPSEEETTMPDMGDPEIAQRFAEFMRQDKANRKK